MENIQALKFDLDHTLSFIKENHLMSEKNIFYLNFMRILHVYITKEWERKKQRLTLASYLSKNK